MNPYDEYDEDGASRAQVWRRQQAERNFVAPMPAPLATRQPTMIDAAPSYLVERQPLGLSTAWEAQQGAREATSAQDRAKALRTRLQPFLIAWGAVSIVVGGGIWLVAGALPVGALLASLTFASLTAVTYTRQIRQDYEYSREGTERHRISTAADLARQQMGQEHELRRMALESYLQALERREGKQ